MPGGKRLYNVQKYLEKNNLISNDKIPKKNICYCRVSTIGQKPDLQRINEKFISKLRNNRIYS